METTAQSLKLLDHVINNFRITLKNSMFYESSHSINVFSINNLKTSLDQWFQHKNKIELGISQDHIFLNGKAIKEKNEFYSDVANYLHTRGLISLSISSGVGVKELSDFFNVIRLDRKTIREKGGVLKNISKSRHLEIKEIDYSDLLTSSQEQVKSEEDKIWQFLFDIAEESKEGELPKSKVEFLIDFFKDSKHSAKTLNKIYRDAVNQLQDETSVENIRKAIQQICQYMEKHSSRKAKDLKIQLMNVISQLHPDLIHTLFEQTVGSTQDFDLVESITKDFSEDYIAEFIESLISSEDTFNENLLKVFDKLVPGETKANTVVSMVADKLFSRRILNPAILSKLQMSIMEIFKRHPESNFMNQIYKITVDAVMNKKIDTLVYMARLSPLINKFVQSMEKEQLKKEHIWLLLNILWLENDAAEFKKFTNKLLSILPELLDTRDTERLREIVDFFTEKTRPEQRNNESMVSEIKEGLKCITSKETLDSLICIVPEATQKELEDIAFILIQSRADCHRLLVDAFITDKNPAHRNKFWHLFLKMKNEISREAINRLEYCEPVLVRDLFLILKGCDTKKLHLAAKKLIRHKNAQIRWEALEVFEPETEEEINAVLKILKKEKHKGVKKKATSLLLKTDDPNTVDKLFKYAEKNIFNKKYLLELIELCGYIRVQTALIHMKRLFFKKVLFNTKKRDDLRTDIITSAARYKTEEAVSFVKRGLHDRSKRVREMSEILMKLEE